MASKAKGKPTGKSTRVDVITMPKSKSTHPSSLRLAKANV
jgi:hypothetical protein